MPILPHAARIAAAPAANTLAGCAMTLVYKICVAAEWTAAARAGLYRGSAADAADGFIHLSTADQVAETLRRHFAGARGLVLVAFDDAALGADLRYEPSRGGEPFPHVYAPLDPSAALWVRAIADDRGGGHTLPDLGR